MSSLPPEDFLPVLVADLADEESREVLDAAAFNGGRVLVPLEDAPVNASQHVLEVHIPGMKEPLQYLATPLGPPVEGGFPLRIHPMPNAASKAPQPKDSLSGALRPRKKSREDKELSQSHTKDLSHVGPLPKEEDQLVGRALAGGKLTIESLIGRGGVGAVYKAVHRELKMSVAVKVLHESFQHDLDFCRRFYAEALAASRLDHPNVTRVIDFGQEPDGLLYLAMEFLDGVELRSVLEKERVLETERIAEIMMQVCGGLSHAHARGIVHRDIKPENLVLVPGHDDDGSPIEVVKVCDFGIAQHRALDMDTTAAGTPEYMSPEQCRGDELDARSDVYACGIVLYELATGQLPFQAAQAHEILRKHLQTPPLPPSKIHPGVDPLLERITMKALAKDPAQRQQSMRELRLELRELLSPILLEDASPSPPPSSVADVNTAKARPRSAPEWLERGPVYQKAESATRLSTPEAFAPPSSVVRDELADALSMDAAGWIQRFTKVADPHQFSQLAYRLDAALRALAARGDAKTLWTVSSALQSMTMQTKGDDSRAYAASVVLRVFEDPAVLGAVAEHLLRGGGEQREYARRLLLSANVAGAYGVYGARVKLAGDPAVRAPFCAAVKDFGPKAWPVVRAALEKLAAMKEMNAGALELAEDLLLCVQAIGDESAGNLVVKYLRVNVSGVCRAATAAIVKLWGERAKPLLVGMLQSKDDVVRIAGIAGLKQLSGIDEHVVPRLHFILLKRLPAGEEVRAAAAVALAHATPSARQPALSLLAQLVSNKDPAPQSRSGTTLSKEDAVLVAAARSLLTLGGAAYRSAVAERADKSPEPLRGQLRMLLS